MQKSEITLEEKVDYIYNSLKKQQRNQKIKNILLSFLCLVLIWFIFFYIPYYINSQIEKLKNVLPKIGNWQITDMVKDGFDTIKNTFTDLDF